MTAVLVVLTIVVGIALWRAKVPAFRRLVFGALLLVLFIAASIGGGFAWVQHARTIDNWVVATFGGWAETCPRETPYVFMFKNGTSHPVSAIVLTLSAHFQERSSVIWNGRVETDHLLSPGQEQSWCYSLDLPDRDVYGNTATPPVEISIDGIYFYYVGEEPEKGTLEQNLVTHSEDRGWRRGSTDATRSSPVTLTSFASPCRDRRASRNEFELQQQETACSQRTSQYAPGGEDPCAAAAGQRLADGASYQAIAEFERSCKFGNWWGCFCRSDIKRIIGNETEACPFFDQMRGTFKQRCQNLEKAKKTVFDSMATETVKYCATRDYVEWALKQSCGQ